MTRLKLLAITLLFACFSYGQTIKIQTGVSVSNLDWKFNSQYQMFEQENFIGVPVFIGLDYFEKKYFNLSTNFGYIKKGGEVTLKAKPKPFTPGLVDAGEVLPDKGLRSYLNYLSLNTTFDFNYPFNIGITPFVGVGPRIDFLLTDESFYNKYNYGLLMGGGVKYDINKLRVGLRFDYYLNFNDLFKTEQYGTLNDRTFTTNLIIGYRLK